jgi:hypothetical protein
VRLRPNRGLPLSLALKRYTRKFSPRYFTPPDQERRDFPSRISILPMPRAAHLAIDSNDGFVGSAVEGRA